MTAYIHAIFMPADRSRYTADIIAAFQNNDLKVPRLPQKLIGGISPAGPAPIIITFFNAVPTSFILTPHIVSIIRDWNTFVYVNPRKPKHNW